MTATNTPKEIAAGFALAGLTLGLGVYLSMKAGDEGGTAVIRIFYAVAVLIVLRVTFAWGRRRGFPAVNEDGGIVVSNVLRNVVMAGLVWVVLILLIAPLIMAAFRLAR